MKVRFLVFLVLSVAAGASAANPQVTLHVIGAVEGDIVLELYPDKAPITVENFIDYVRSGFYDGLIFHRVVEYDPPLSTYGIIQGGGYDTDMVKKPTGPPIINESYYSLSNLAGTLAMARTSHPHSATSQFYINQVDNTGFDFGQIGLDGDTAYYKVGYCVFGRVISPMSVVNAIVVLPTTADRPDVDVVIESATVTLEAPFCTEKLDGDIDGDCNVDAEEIMKFAIQWLNPTCHGCYSGDINNDGEVNFADFVRIANDWLKCNSITTPCE